MTESGVSKQILGLCGWLAVTFVAAVVGAIASTQADSFYAELTRPSWAPPASWFGPVWSVLYVLMAVAAWVVWRVPPEARARTPLVLFLVQLTVNALWSWLFFHWRLGGVAFADIVVLLALIAATVVSFWRVKRLAGALLVPYLCWVSFATVLNWSIWQSNPTLLSGGLTRSRGDALCAQDSRNPYLHFNQVRPGLRSSRNSDLIGTAAVDGALVEPCGRIRTPMAGRSYPVTKPLTEDAVSLVPGKPAMRKSEFAAAARAQATGHAPTFDGLSDIQEVQVSGDWAFMWSKLTAVATPPGGGASTTRSGHTLTVFRRRGGRRLLARDANLLAPVPRETQ